MVLLTFFFLRFSCFVSLASLPRSNHGYQTAWVPPNCGMVGSGREECCIFEACRAQVQRRVAGWDSENNEQQLLQTTKRNTPAKWKRMQIRYGSKPLAEASSERVVCNFGTKAACFLRWSYWSVQFPQEVFFGINQLQSRLLSARNLFVFHCRIRTLHTKAGFLYFQSQQGSSKGSRLVQLMMTWSRTQTKLKASWKRRAKGGGLALGSQKPVYYLAIEHAKAVWDVSLLPTNCACKSCY